MAIVTITNIRSELKAYRVLSSDLKSFLNISTELLNKMTFYYKNTTDIIEIKAINLP